LHNKNNILRFNAKKGGRKYAIGEGNGSFEHNKETFKKRRQKYGQCTCNATLRRVHIAIFSVEKQ